MPEGPTSPQSGCVPLENGACNLRGLGFRRARGPQSLADLGYHSSFPTIGLKVRTLPAGDDAQHSTASPATRSKTQSGIKRRGRQLET